MLTKNNKNDKDEKTISKKLITRNLDKNSYEQIEKYVKQILVEKNNYAKILSNDLLTKYAIVQGLGKFKFSSKYQKLELADKSCPKSDLQSAREDVFTKFKNQKDQLNIKFVKTYKNKKYNELKSKNKLKDYPNCKSFFNTCKDDNLQNLLNFLCSQLLFVRKDDTMKLIFNNLLKNGYSEQDLYNDLYNYYVIFDNQIKDRIFSKNTRTYVNWQKLINKLSFKRLMNLALKKFLRELKNLKITFNKATIQHKNTISSLDNHFEKVSNIKFNNLVFNVNLPNIGVIKLPFKYNKKYHCFLDSANNSLNISYTNKDKKMSEKYRQYNYFIQSVLIYTIKLDEINKEVQIIYTLKKNDTNSKKFVQFDSSFKIEYEKTVGIDVNTKNNIFQLSDGKTFKYDKWIIKKCKSFDKMRADFQRNNKNKKYNEKMLKLQNKLNRRSKAFLDKKVNELIKYCISKNYNHIVMENLNIQKCSTNIRSKNGLNYNRLASLIHLNDVKNVIKRIANHYGIMVSFVDPKFTSKQCLICGNIDNENRLNQETFKCTKHDLISNADLNAACNIKNRIAIFKDKLTFKFDEDFNGFKQSKYNSKNDYLEMYKNFDKMLIMDQIWKVFKL